MVLPAFRPQAFDILSPSSPRWMPVDAPTSAPYGAICRLTIQFSGGTAQGTGWYAGSRLILTAGHCVFYKDAGGWARSIEAVFPTGGHFRINDPGRFLSTSSWVSHEDSWNDIGGIVLPQSAGSGYLPTGGDPVGIGRSVLICGYPNIANGMWVHNGPVHGSLGRRVFYDVDVDDGQSGAPLLVWEAGRWRVAGLHLHDPDGVPLSVPLPRRCNGGLTIDAQIHALLGEWGANA